MSLNLFPGALPVEEYVARTTEVCRPHGFAPGNTLPMVGLCRDELSDLLADPIRATWGSPFRMSGLAGMLFLGTAGVNAGLHHAPDDDGRRRYVVHLAPHLGIGSDGTVGYVSRPGQKQDTTACGALMAVRGVLESGSVPTELDPLNPELGLLLRRVVPAIPTGTVPDIAALTAIVRDVIAEDFRDLTGRLDGWADADVAVFTGIHLHTSDGDHVQPGPAYVRLAGGQESPLTF